MRDFSFSFLFKFLFEKALFGRSLAQLILAALSLYPFGVKEGQERRFLSDVPFGRFCLAMYPSADFAASGSRHIINTWVRQGPRKMGASGRVAARPLWTLIVVPFGS